MDEVSRIASGCVSCALCALMLGGCAVASAGEYLREEFSYVCDIAQERDPEGATRILLEQEEREAEEAARAEREAAEAAAQAEAEPVYQEAYHEPYSAPQPPAGDGFKQQGVREYDGRTETWYSSNIAYHHRTGEWEVDEEGYYRTEEGYYVVAASDMEQGTVFETSKGEAIVLDSGCDDGVTDFYTAF